MSFGTQDEMHIPNSMTTNHLNPNCQSCSARRPKPATFTLQMFELSSQLGRFGSACEEGTASSPKAALLNEEDN